jgi:hypothetical protein
MAGLCYGGGLRREDCCRLRVHDLDTDLTDANAQAAAAASMALDVRRH